MQLNSQSMYWWIDRITVVHDRFYRLFGAIAGMAQSSRFVLHTCGKLRRLRLVHFNKKYVSQQLSARQGSCRQCGTCCNLLFTCPALTKKGRCLVYGTCRPQSCKVFPIDQRDIDEVKFGNSHCGFHFVAEAADHNQDSEAG